MFCSPAYIEKCESIADAATAGLRAEYDAAEMASRAAYDDWLAARNLAKRSRAREAAAQLERASYAVEEANRLETELRARFCTAWLRAKRIAIVAPRRALNDAQTAFQF